MRVVIIGAIAAGMSAAAKAKRTNPEAEIVVIEKEDYVSFGACGLPYYVGGEFVDSNEMFARTPEQIEASGIQLLLKHEARGIDFKNQRVRIKNLMNDELLQITYDRLLIATGAQPLIPEELNGVYDNLYTMTKLVDADKFLAKLSDYRNILIIGGGFIGLEFADQLHKLGKKVSLIERNSQLLSMPFDQEIADKLLSAVEELGTAVYLNQEIKEVNSIDGSITNVITDSMTFKPDAVIVAAGFTPNTKFIDDSIEKLPNGAIIIDEYGETSLKNVFSAGDAASVKHRLLGNTYLPLATIANKMGRIIGNNIVTASEKWQKFSGALGSSAVKVGNFEAGSTGLTEKQAQELKIDYRTTCIETNNHSNYYTVQEKITIKLVYHAETKVLLGAQVFGKNEAVLRLTGLSTAVHARMTTTELGFLDYAYAPPFSSTWEAINVAANTAK